MGVHAGDWVFRFSFPSDNRQMCPVSRSALLFLWSAIRRQLQRSASGMSESFVIGATRGASRHLARIFRSSYATWRIGLSGSLPKGFICRLNEPSQKFSHFRHSHSLPCTSVVPWHFVFSKKSKPAAREQLLHHQPGPVQSHLCGRDADFQNLSHLTSI